MRLIFALLVMLLAGCKDFGRQPLFSLESPAMAPTPSAEKQKQKITVGRMLHAYSNKWTGPRPAVVSNAFDSVDYANVNVLFDGANDQECLAAVRGSSSGNTFPSVNVYEPMTPEQRAVMLDKTKERQDWGGVRGRSLKVICEWPR